jgi:hypothetical protein
MIRFRRQIIKARWATIIYIAVRGHTRLTLFEITTWVTPYGMLRSCSICALDVANCFETHREWLALNFSGRHGRIRETAIERARRRLYACQLSIESTL